MATILRFTAGGFLPEPISGEGRQVLAGETVLVSFQDGSRSQYILVSQDGEKTQVNGEPLVGGLRVLRHRDELLVEGDRLYFSAQTTPVVEAYQHQGDAKPPRCPICRAEIKDGDLVVRCPGCTRVYHQSTGVEGQDDRPCWTYCRTCKFCEHPTSLTGEDAWQPDEDLL